MRIGAHAEIEEVGAGLPALLGLALRGLIDHIQTILGGLCPGSRPGWLGDWLARAAAVAAAVAVCSFLVWVPRWSHRFPYLNLKGCALPVDPKIKQMQNI